MIRSLIGIVLLVLGAVTAIALLLPGQGALTDGWRNVSVPFFGSGRWALPAVLLLAGWYLEWGPGKEPGAPWGRTLLGIAVAYAGFLGAFQVAVDRGGGRIGRFLANLLEPALTTPGAFVILLGIGIAGLLIALDLPLRSLLSPATRSVQAAASTLQDRTVKGDDLAPVRAKGDPVTAGVGPVPADGGRRGRAQRGAVPEIPGQTGVWGENGDAGIPVATPSTGPTSSTFAPVRVAGGAAGASVTGAGAAAAGAAGVVAAGAAVGATGAAGTNGSARDQRAAARDPEDVTDASDLPPTRDLVEWSIPPHELLDLAEPPLPAAGAAADLVHARNEEIIVKKLGSFDIEARIVGRNAGPVVTQYEVQPAPHIKVSRIEGLSDDLAMALAARSIRIEAPIPGKSAVGIEIPNKEFNVVALRRILEEVDVKASGSRLTFALGRDVAGRAQAVDLAKMPHLLIAGATGSGKSVMVNALITSILCNATPTDVRMILMDLKRVELAGYNGLPHLLVPVITEPERAKAALKWAVGEMENRYRRFAGAASRNIKAFNDSRVDPADRLPYIVVIIDELADLMMREGKNVEDPIVRLAQKARATGIHMVLATQRPSVNVVTGLIKANFPSRIAFAMASQIDSRTILDQPGAEDLIGRGDMLYQPSDLPRPMRLQGVFVSDPEIHRVTEHWRNQIDDPRYDLSIIANDEESTGSVEELADEEADRLLMDAVNVVREYDRASASLLQRRLKIGYARAARIIDQLEARGYVGAFDGSNARVVLRRDDGPGPDEDEDEG
ncbi:MAG TPA: DNA translocase FtsK 4TM domain-containing protein [Candidatus Limnocylindrales bacterium]|nr:DNA translocase FtsK 4TM domain-containing protein [Candidatus Limnocylindrales bacterium]